jgi:type 1 glutamine amidotransferase
MVKDEMGLIGGDPPEARTVGRARFRRRLRDIARTFAILIAAVACRGPAAPCPDVAALPDGAPRVLLYTRTTGYRHASIEPAVCALRQALAAESVASDAHEDLNRITADALAQYKAVIVISTTGEPFGYGDSPQALALLDFVRAGGGFVGLHDATENDPHGQYPVFIGANFVGHPGDVRDASCFHEGTHPAIDRLPPEWRVHDEIHVVDTFRDDNLVLLRCTSFDQKTELPIAWQRAEGQGRLFISLLGHPSDLWTAAGDLVQLHDLPAILWAAQIVR